MQIGHQKRGNYLLVKADGRLDASWSEHFSSTLHEYIRLGHHYILLDAAGMAFLSSAGIRAMVQIVKSIKLVNGSFQIIEANDFVKQTLTMTGFGSWLAEEVPSGSIKEDIMLSGGYQIGFEEYELNSQAFLNLSIPARWQPWDRFDPNEVSKMQFNSMDFALGIGCPGQSMAEYRSLMGEFLVVAGNVVHQPPSEGEKPDFLLTEKDYYPELNCIQALSCKGEMSHLLRFSPLDECSSFGLGEIAGQVLHATGSETSAFVLLSEIDGLVGSNIIKSPGLLVEDRVISFPEIKEWLSFCGERMYFRQQALVFGLVARPLVKKQPSLLVASKKYEGLNLHAHAAVFPFQPLESGNINLKKAVMKFFNGPPPMALYHLVEDMRSVTGFGESAFTRGACWCAPIKNYQEDKLWE
jgi:anti-anti-sigma factor